ncbi:MAG: hypothetical protein HQ591_08640 [candidate division Zixibacteria bacterium]|nr:hypothetical protein [Candidatus Tariuqbacter arcticus]
MKKLFILALILVFSTSLAFADDSFQEELQKLAEDNARGYIFPAPTAFGSAINSGLFHTAKTHAPFLGFDISFKMMLAMVPDEDMTFDFALPSDPISIPGYNFSLSMADIYDNEAPTLFGEFKDGLTIDPVLLAQVIEDSIGSPFTEEQAQQLIDNNPGLFPIIPLPPGYDIKGLPLMIPQVSFGLPMKSEVMLRFFPKTEISEDMGEFGFFGIGLKHSISQYIPLFPVSVSAQFAYQSINFGDIITSNHTAFNIIASKGLVLFTPYVGLGFESSSFEVDYTYYNPNIPNDPGTPIKFDIDGENNFHMRFGVNFKLLLIGINAEYAMGKYDVVTVGAYITFF